MKRNEKKAIKEKNILDTAVRLFSEKGLKGTTIEDIALQSGIAKGTFYLYFKDKHDLFSHIMENLSYEHEKRQLSIHELSSWEEKLKHYILMQVDFFSSNLFLARISVKEVYGLNEETARIFFKAIDRHVNLLTAIIKGGCKAGEFEADNIRKTAAACLGMINYYILYENLEYKICDSNNEKTAEFLYTLLMKGLQKKTAVL